MHSRSGSSRGSRTGGFSPEGHTYPRFMKSQLHPRSIFENVLYDHRHISRLAQGNVRTKFAIFTNISDFSYDRRVMRALIELGRNVAEATGWSVWSGSNAKRARCISEASTACPSSRAK